ncbi:MAG TPA: FCD domain-containing protein [Gemmatirosa sp.]
MLRSVPRQQVVDGVIAQLQAQIEGGAFPVGERLPTEPELMAQLGVGRSTVREAVRALAHAGLLEVRQGAGTFVRARRPAPGGTVEAQLRRAAILEVYEARRALELETARLAAARRDADDLAALRAHLDQRHAADAAGDRAAFVTADVAFHEAVARAAKNGVLLALYRAFAAALSDALAAQLADSALDPGDVAPLHETLLSAIATGDAAAAVGATAELLDQTIERLRRMTEQGPQTDSRELMQTTSAT